MILTQSQRELITKRLRQAGIGEKDFFVRKLSLEEIPRYLKAANIALSFI